LKNSWWIGTTSVVATSVFDHSLPPSIIHLPMAKSHRERRRACWRRRAGAGQRRVRAAWVSSAGERGRAGWTGAASRRRGQLGACSDGFSLGLCARQVWAAGAGRQPGAARRAVQARADALFSGSIKALLVASEASARDPNRGRRGASRVS